MPRTPGSLLTRSSSSTARSGSSMGSIASTTKRSGCALCAATASSFQARESRSARSPSAQLTIGVVSKSACMATPLASMSASRSLRSMNFDGNGPFEPAGLSVKTPAGSNGPLPSKFIDLKERLADMDASGVAMHALSLTVPMVNWADGDLALRLSRSWNDDAVAAHKAYPDRFVVLAMLPMLDPDRAIDELDRVGKLPGVRGIYMGTNINNRDLDDPLFEPIFARIEAADLPVFLHPLQTIGGKRLGVFYLNNLLGNPFDTAIAACHLVFGGVMDRHPKL